MYPSFIIGRTVAGTWEFLTPAPVRRSEAREVFDAIVGAKGVHEGTPYVEVAVYDVPRASETGRFAPPSTGGIAADPTPAQPRTSAVSAGAAAGAETRESYIARVGAMDRPKLILEGHKLNLTIRVGTTNPDLRAVLVNAKFPPGGEVDGDSGV